MTIEEIPQTATWPFATCTYPIGLVIGLLFRLGPRILIVSLELNVSPIAPCSIVLLSLVMRGARNSPSVSSSWSSFASSPFSSIPHQFCTLIDVVSNMGGCCEVGQKNNLCM